MPSRVRPSERRLCSGISQFGDWTTSLFDRPERFKRNKHHLEVVDDNVS
jgi:hypothetical protein